jgi:Cu/Ag efflux pump CusA
LKIEDRRLRAKQSGRKFEVLSSFIALFGVAVLNGVAPIAAINRLREGGRAVEDGPA